MNYQQGSNNLNPENGGPDRHRRSGRNGYRQGSNNLNPENGGPDRPERSGRNGYRQGSNNLNPERDGLDRPERSGRNGYRQGSNNLNPGSGGPKRAGGFALPKTVFGMDIRKAALIGVLGVVLIWASVSIISRWIVPNAREKQVLDDTRALVGATLAPGETVAAPAVEVTVGPTVITVTTSEPRETAEAAPVAYVTAPPGVSPNVTARISFNGLTYSPELLDDYIALYAANRDMGGWIRVRAIKNIDFAYVRGRNDYYITHDFYGNENVNGTAFLDETCTDWPRDKNLLIYAHNLRSGEMFGELNRIASMKVIRGNPFVDCDSLYEKGVYIPVAVLVCAVDAAEEDYFDFHVSDFSSAEAFDAYIARCRELSQVALNVDVDFSDQLLTLVTCCDDTGTRRFLMVCRRLRADETEESVLAKYFR